MVSMRPRKARLDVLLTLLAAISLWLAGIAVGDQPNKPCREHPKLIGPCFTVHARMRYYNGAPSVRLWPVGTNRLLGVSEGQFEVSETLPQSFRETLDSQREIYADFVVCPFTPDEVAVMRLVCVDSATNIVTKSVAAW